MMEIFQRIDIADIIDVTMVALLLYAGLVWFKRTRAFLILIGIVILGVVYAAARFFNLFLTTAIMQGFFAVLLIAMIVIFQEELRQFFERVALWGLGRREERSSSEVVDVLARTSIDLARKRCGALIVIAGRDPLDRQVSGGQPLDGLPTEVLLQSVFDPHSPGHDGAVVVRGGRIVRFAGYLPLSKDLKKTAGYGTRHAAAVGLSERCDALCIVVSEERGSISVVRDGELNALNDPSELAPELYAFMREKFPPPEKHRFLDFLRVNKGEKLAAVLLAMGLWIVFSQGFGVMQRDFTIPIEFANVPEGLIVERSSPRRLIVTISGDERAFKLLSEEELKASIDLEDGTPGRQAVRVHRDDIVDVPRALSVEAIRPAEVDLILAPAK